MLSPPPIVKDDEEPVSLKPELNNLAKEISEKETQILNNIEEKIQYLNHAEELLKNKTLSNIVAELNPHEVEVLKTKVETLIKSELITEETLLKEYPQVYNLITK